MNDFWYLDFTRIDDQNVIVVLAGDLPVMTLYPWQLDRAAAMCRWRNDVLSRAYIEAAPRRWAA